MQITSQELDFENCRRVIEYHRYHRAAYRHSFFDTDKFFMVAVRGHYLDSVGAKGRNDINLLDDLICAVNLENGFYLAARGNTDPSYAGHDKASLRAGVIRYYRGDHRGQYLAFRPFPEGVRLPCTRDGRPADCALTNIHGCADEVDGIGYDTHSEGCLTMPITFFKNTFRPACYEQIERFHATRAPVKNERWATEKNGTKHFALILLEKRRAPDEGVNRIYSATGEPLDLK
jgi:hypothetical protein